MGELPPGYNEAVSHLRDAGMDLISTFNASDYNRLIETHDWLKPINTFERDRALAVVVANTRHLWEPLKRAVKAQPEQLAADPVDRHVELSVRAARQRISARSEVHFGHTLGEAMVSMLHAAQASGLAHPGPAYMAVHPEHGLWFAMRALIVLDWPWTGETTTAPDMCSTCQAPCLAALQRAQQHATPTTAEDMSSNWRAWVKIRDVCPVGRSSRYSEEQIIYHYTHDTNALQSA